MIIIEMLLLIIKRDVLIIHNGLKLSKSQFHFPFKFLFFVYFSSSSVSLCFGQAQILSWSSLTIFPFH